MRISYAGQTGTAHTDAYLRFLGGLGEATFIDIDRLADADLAACDLLVVDAGQWDHPLPEGLTRDHLRPATALVGTFGVKLADQLQLKFGSNYGCMCLGEDAIAWDEGHPAFAGITGNIVGKAPPPNFKAFTSILDVPDELPTLRVLREDIGVPGQVTAGFGFLDSPDCEIIAGGFNEKTSAHFAIARQGRFLHWGFSGSPDQYTPEGCSLLANCLRHLLGFANDPVREARTTDPREILRFMLALNGWRGIGLPAEIRAPIMEAFLRQLFAMPIPPEAFGEREERLAWFEANAAYLRNDGQGWYVDADARAMGFAIDDPALLEACLASPDERSGRVWERYARRPATDLASERGWLAHHRRHLYFTEWGGYRWVSRLEPARPLAPAEKPASTEASATMGAARYDDRVKVMIMMNIPPGFHAYAPGSDEGLPLTVLPDAGFELVDEIQVHSNDGHISGGAAVMFSVKGAGDELSLSLRLQLCDSLTCLMPQTLELRCPIVSS